MARPLHLPAAIALALAVSACASLLGSKAPFRIENATLVPPASDTIAADLVNQLVTQLGQAEATILLEGQGTQFAHSLETALRTTGYAVATRAEGQTGALPLAYVVEPFDAGVLVRIAIPTLSLGRLYALEHGDALPAGPFSVSRVEP